MKTILKNPAKERQNYVSPELEVVDLQIESSVCLVASMGGGIDNANGIDWDEL